MPARDHHHDIVRRALIKDGWTLTHDPFTVLLPERFLYIDLRVEKAEEQRAIIVEIKGFELASQVEALAAAIGKYNLYKSALVLTGINDSLFLAVPLVAYQGILSEALGQHLIGEHNVHLIVFDPDKEEIVQWNP